MDAKLVQKKDEKLRGAAKAFVQKFNEAVVTSRDEALRISKARGALAFEGGIVEFTPDLTSALDKFVLRAAQLLGPKSANESAIRESALTEVRKCFIEKITSDTTASRLIDRIFEEGTAQFEFLVPNYLITFHDTVTSIEIGPVRAALTSDLAAELQNRKPNDRIKVISGQGFSLRLVGTPPVVHIEMYRTAWLVSVSAAKENIEEEAKWLIDVAVSLLRLQYKVEGRRFPGLGTIEPHPTRPKEVDSVGVKIKGSTAFFGGGIVPHAYEVTSEVKSTTVDEQFCSKAALIFNAPSKSVAARVSQGLGWLTRGRQAEDRAERLLYFFTAIESLLSNDDKTAPVVQTISRHAAVVLTDGIKERVGLSKEIKKLYSLRSALVHSGNRGVLWDAAKATQFLAEAMFMRVLDHVDLKMSHSDFCKQLSDASFGLPWPTSD
jgi:hypothetical protein